MRIPFFIIPLLAIMIIMPIISIEGVTPWVLFLYFSYKIIKFSLNTNDNKAILKTSINYLLINIILIFIYNLIIYFATSFIIKNIL